MPIPSPLANLLAGCCVIGIACLVITACAGAVIELVKVVV